MASNEERDSNGIPTQDLQLFPNLTFAEVQNYAKNSSGCTSTSKAYKFFAEPGYLHNIQEIQNLPNESNSLTNAKLITALVTQKENPTENHKNCSIPNDWLYPLCEYKVKWLRDLWRTNPACYIDRHKMDPKDDCSILIFLSEVETWCPFLPWRRHLYAVNKDLDKEEKVQIREELSGLFHKMNDGKYQWMRDRISRLWPDWIGAAKNLEGTNPTVRNRKFQNIFLYMGTFSHETEWLPNAYRGVPLGEMVQWSDLAASLYVLGHNLTIVSDIPIMKTLLNATSDKNCSRRLRNKEFDLLFTDYVGAAIIRDELGPTSSHYRCHLRILDSFGTDPEFNYAEYKGREKTFWGGADVHVRQMMTMFPHSPDNLFLGFVVDRAVVLETNQASVPQETKQKQKPIGLVYGKDAVYFQGRQKYIEVLSKYMEIHATVNKQTTGAREAIKKFVPEVVINHGILKGEDLQTLLRRSKVFIGLAFPYEGPAPLEAISQGCVFLNPKLNPPLSRINSDFFSGKPTFRELTSQHPYMETFIGKPHVYTIDINDLNLVERTIKQILSLEVEPFLPYEWTTGGMLERVNMFSEKLNFCESSEQWPPVKELRPIFSSIGMSCKEACATAGFLCESSYFRFINKFEEFEKIAIPCKALRKEESLYAPSYQPTDQSCTVQTMPLLFSCVAKDPLHMRLCPCRDFQQQQVAFCKKCR